MKRFRIGLVFAWLVSTLSFQNCERMSVLNGQSNSAAPSFSLAAPAESTIDSVQIVSRKSNLCLDVVGEANAAALQQYNCLGDAQLNQIYTFVPAGDGFFQIVSMGSGKCLDVVDASKAHGARVQQYDCFAFRPPHQLWRVVAVAGASQIISKNSGMCLDVVGGATTASDLNGASIQQWECGGASATHQLWAVDLAPSPCDVRDVASMKACSQQGANSGVAWQAIRFLNDVTCTGSECCPASETGGSLTLDRVKGVIVLGNGHTLKRIGQQSCPAIDITSSSAILVQSLNVSDDPTVPSCRYGPTYVPTSSCLRSASSSRQIEGQVRINGSRSIGLSDVGLYHSQVSGVNVENCDRVSLDRSVIADAGVMGFYAGNGEFANDGSTNISITHSIFAHIRTNAIVFQGVGLTPEQVGRNLIANNIINDTQYDGAWLDASGRGSNGGQIFIEYSSRIDITGNVIADGSCPTCSNPFGISAFELQSLSSQPTSMPQHRLSHLSIWDNSLYNQSADAFQMDAGGRLDPGTTIINTNLIYGAPSPYGYVSFVASGSVDAFAAFFGAGTSNVFDAVGPPSLPSLAQARTATSVRVYNVYRLTQGGFHQEAQTSDERPGSSVEATMTLSPSPRLGARKSPIYRCFMRDSRLNDFPSFDANCEGQGKFHSILGYSYGPDDPGAIPFYRCARAGDAFISWDVRCEGQRFVETLGYAVAN